MTLLFICAGLEPGRDGVGDYTRRLAAACIARGHPCTLLALHDPHIARRHDDTSDALHVIRLPADSPWPERLAYAVDRTLRLAPDWISWQFVAYGFHPRGFLPATLLQAAASFRGPLCHVMLHELWLGLEVGAPLRDRALGWLQRRGVTCLLDQLDADVVHTSNVTYRAALGREGYDSDVLPLFGNVPIAPDPSSPSAHFTGVTFGTLHPQWQPAATADWLLATARRHQRTPVLVALGRAGAHAAALLGVFRERGIAVTETGELDHASVSRL
ncbi:MAG: glycosyltransferase, partial [Burkholderiales bacterium]|nr:glycosyltransferase [Opitutaceae bacterium]